MEIHPDFSDLLLAFNVEGVRYLVIGAHAMAVHGRARATKDLDIFVESDPDNADRVYRALASFGAPLDGVSVSDFASDDLVFQIGTAPIRIDILTSIEGVTFADAWPERVETVLGQISVNTIGRSALIRNKRSLGRAQDIADIEALGSVD